MIIVHVVKSNFSYIREIVDIMTKKQDYAKYTKQTRCIKSAVFTRLMKKIRQNIQKRIAVFIGKIKNEIPRPKGRGI